MHYLSWNSFLAFFFYSEIEALCAEVAEIWVIFIFLNLLLWKDKKKVCM